MSKHRMVAHRDVLCTQCDAPNDSESMYCDNCGTALARGSTTSQSPFAPSTRLLGCLNCGITNPAGARYCVNCGASVAPIAPTPSDSYASGSLISPTGTPNTTIVQNIYIGTTAPEPRELPLLARALWFLFVGLWAGQLWLVGAWLANITIIGLPAGMWMLSMLPQVMTLRTKRRRPLVVPTQAAATFAVRAVYFVLIGWWLSLVWMELAWLLSATIIGLPLSFLMFERVGAVMTMADA